MIPYKDIYALRREKRLDEARSLAEQALASGQNDENILKAYAWTLIDIIKKEKTAGNPTAAEQAYQILSGLEIAQDGDDFTETLLKNIERLSRLIDPAYEKIREAQQLSKEGENEAALAIYDELAAGGSLPTHAYESYGWCLYRFLRDHASELTSVQRRRRLKDYLDLQNERPSRLHSLMLFTALNCASDDERFHFFSFFKLWGPENLSEDDWKEGLGENNATFRPLALRAIKKAKEDLDRLTDVEPEAFQWLIDLYDKAIQKYPDDDWNERSKAQLLLRAGQVEAARRIYADLCLTLGDKFYIWQEFADCWDDLSLKEALLCKAISVEKKEEFIGKTRVALARILAETEKDDNAAVELRQYVSLYEKNGWKVDPQISEWLAGHPVDKSPVKDNHALYEELIPKAEQLAYSDLPAKDVVLVRKWKTQEGKDRMLFTDGHTSFLINPRKFQPLNHAHIGQVWHIKLHSDAKGLAPVFFEPSDEADWSRLTLHYGFVQYINVAKKAYHILSAESRLFFEHFRKDRLKTGDLVRFRCFEESFKGERRLVCCGVEICSEAEALPHFQSGTATVNFANQEKGFFQLSLQAERLSGILRFSQTDLHLSAGDSLRIHYVKRKLEDKKNPRRFKTVFEVVRASL